MIGRRNKIGCTFDSLFITPIQRLPRYEMLINQIIKYTNTDDPDYENLQKASKSIKEINVKNNEFMGRHAKQKRKLELNAIVHEHITLALSHRNLLNEYHDLLVTNIDSKTTKS